jgi:Holliday junction resolvasome RuvABC endonuclease subunit
VIGFDASLTHSGVVFGRSEVASDEPFYVKEMRIKTEVKQHAHAIARLAWLAERLESVFEFANESPGSRWLFIENYAFASKLNREALGEWGGIIRVRAYEHGWRVVPVSIQMLKKYVTGSGAAEKSQMMMQVLKRWGHEASDDNNADAYALMRFGLDYVRSTVGTLQVSKEKAAQFKKLTVFPPRLALALQETG